MGEARKYGWEIHLKKETRKYTTTGEVDFPVFYLKITYESHHKVYNLTFPICYETIT